METEIKVNSLETALTVPIGTSFAEVLDTDPDVLEQLLSDKRSEHTRRAYNTDINDFFRTMTGKLASRDTILEFLHLEQRQAITVVLKYKAKLINKGLKEATINRRLASLKSMVAMGRKLGVCVFSLEDVKGERAAKYRDTSGITPQEFKQVVERCDISTLKGKRDYALLRLLWDNALRRGEVARANVSDFNPDRRSLRILGKGRGTNYEFIDLSPATTQALTDWLKARGKLNPDAPLFISLDHNSKGHRLTGEGIRWIVDSLTQATGISKKMSPHRIRHSAITAALDATDGNVRKVQKLSRHKQIDTLMIYDDNRQRVQGDVTSLLAEMI